MPGINWTKIGSFAQWISALFALIGIIILYRVNQAAQSISIVNTELAVFNRNIQTMNEYFYKLYDASALNAGRCIAYMIAIPGPIFINYINKSPTKGPMFKEGIANIAEILAAIDEMTHNSDKQKKEIKEELYMDYDICLSLSHDKAFYSVKDNDEEIKRRSEVIKKDWLNYYREFSSLYVPYLDFRDHALVLWYNDVLSEESSEGNYVSQHLRDEEIKFTRRIFRDNICHPWNRTAQLLRKVKHCEPDFYETFKRDQMPRFGKFLEEECPAQSDLSRSAGSNAANGCV